MTDNKKYLIATAEGAYYLVQDSSKNWQKNVLRKLFSLPTSPELNSETLKNIFDIEVNNIEDRNYLKNRIKEFQKLQLLKIVDQEVLAPQGDIEQNLIDLIHVFSKNDSVLLSDSHGFCIANHGFSEQVSEEISALSADIAIMHKRRALNINEKLGLNSQAWSIVDAFGKSCLGFWPLNINDEVFVLTIEGRPKFNQQATVSLVWMLYLRYGKK